MLPRELGVARVDNAANGNEATGLLGNHRYDVVLCDYNSAMAATANNCWKKPAAQSGGAGLRLDRGDGGKPEAILGAVEYQPDALPDQACHHCHPGKPSGKTLGTQKRAAGNRQRTCRQNYSRAAAVRPATGIRPPQCQRAATPEKPDSDQRQRLERRSKCFSALDERELPGPEPVWPKAVPARPV